jgi:histidinol dehydrogenase
VEQVRNEGDVAVRSFTSKFDKVELDDVCVSIQVSFNRCNTAGYCVAVPIDPTCAILPVRL